MKVKKITKAEKTAKRVKEEYSHASSSVILNRRSVLVYEAEVVESEINDLGTALSTARERRANLGATIDGLSRALEVRRLE